MVWERSSIGEISSKISSRPDLVLMSVRPSAKAVATRACQAALPISQSNDSICTSRRFGTSRGSAILAKEIRPEAETTLVFFDETTLVFFDAERETAKVMVLPRNPATCRFFARRTARVKSRVVGERWANSHYSAAAGSSQLACEGTSTQLPDAVRGPCPSRPDGSRRRVLQRADAVGPVKGGAAGGNR